MSIYRGEETLSAILAFRAAEQPKRRFIRFEDGSALTYAEMDSDANRMANAMAALGIGPGEKVAVMLPNCPDFMRVWFGLNRAGIVEVPLNNGLRGDFLRHQLALAECRAAIVAPQFAQTVADVVRDLPKLTHLIVTGNGEDWPDFSIPLPTPALDILLTRASEKPPGVTLNPTDPCAIMFTSGTTGPSKGALVTDSMYFHMARVCAEGAEYGREDVLFSVFPLFHINAKYLSILPALIGDSEMVLHKRFTASGFWDICRAEGITAFNYMGAMLLILDKQPLRDNDRGHKVTRAYGAPAPVAMSEVFRERFGVKLLECYGSTELGTTMLSNPANIRPGSCGKPVSFWELDVHDENGDPCPPNVPGELVARPKVPGAMYKGYYRMPEATVAAWRNLWFHTGDLFKKDEDGFFYYLDRMKDAIRRRGENISSWEVEKVIDSHDCVLESAVLGVPSELSEEEVLAVVVCKPGMSITVELVIAHCSPRLPHYAVPRYVRIVAELPKNNSQRIEKFTLRKLGLTPDTWDREAKGGPRLVGQPLVGEKS